MIPASFDEANTVLDPPPEMSIDDCQALNVLRSEDSDGYSVVVSCWKVTKEELDEIQRTGRVWLIVYGNTMPPAMLTGRKPFEG